MAFFIVLFLFFSSPAFAEEGLARSEQAMPLTQIQKLDAIYTQLAKTKTREQARPFEEAFEKTNREHPSATARLLFQRALEATQKNEPQVALQLLSECVTQAPDFTAAFVRRAQIYEQQGQTGLAMNDLNVALKLDPRHYAALLFSAQIFMKIEQPTLALKAYERAFAVNPTLARVKEQIEKLKGVKL